MPRLTVRRFAVLLCFTALLIAPVFAQPTNIKVDGKIIKSYISYLASDASLGRRTMTPAYEKTADWAAGKFKEWGLKPAGENGTYFQKVPITGGRSNYVFALGVPSLVVNGRTFYVRDNDFTIDSASTPGAQVTGELVFVGYGISAAAKGLDEYKGVDVKGKVVVALKGSPTDAPAPRPAMGGGGRGAAAPPAPTGGKDPWAEESTDRAKMTTAFTAGAAAIMLYNPNPPAQGAASGGGGGRGAQTDPKVFTRPFLYVSNIDERLFKWIMWRDVQESSRGFDARMTALRGDIKAKKARSMTLGGKAVIKGYTSASYYGEALKNNFARNVIAKIEGTDPSLKNQYVIAGGHLDHNGVTNGVVYNGADDNASGSATVMEVARVLAVAKAQPKRTLIFALWCGEEEGLIGSQYYADHPTDGVSMDRTVTDFNMDMVGLGDRIGAPGALNFPTIFDVIMKDQDPVVAKKVDPSQAGPGGSDYSAFINLGIEALALMTSGRTGHPDYHDSGDDPAKIEEDILGWTGQFVVQGMLNVANETKVNLIIADRQDIYNAQRFVVFDLTGGTERGWGFVRASTSEDLLALALQRAKDLRNPPATGQAQGRGGRGGAGGRLTTGVRGAGLFLASVKLFETTNALLDFGRIDVTGNDGYWFGDKVTSEGRDALKAIESANVAINLVNPPASLVADFTDAAQKPFIVTNPAGFDAAMADRLKKKNAIVIVDCSPTDVDGCVKRLGATQTLVGKNNLLLSMSSGQNRADAVQKLYMALVKAGWTKAEIGAMVGTGQNNNLSRFMPPAQGRGM
jgi:Peptidase family M28/PA domain